MAIGQLLRLPEETPTKQALHEALRKVKKLRGQSKLTWLSLIQKDISGQGLHTDKLDALIDLANDKKAWCGIIRVAR